MRDSDRHRNRERGREIEEEKEREREQSDVRSPSQRKQIADDRTTTRPRHKAKCGWKVLQGSNEEACKIKYDSGGRDATKGADHLVSPKMNVGRHYSPAVRPETTKSLQGGTKIHGSRRFLRAGYKQVRIQKSGTTQVAMNTGRRFGTSSTVPLKGAQQKSFIFFCYNMYSRNLQYCLSLPLLPLLGAPRCRRRCRCVRGQLM